MSVFELFLTGVGLSMDAFAVAICKGLGMRKFNGRQALLIALFFGGFQALMPLLGYLLGRQFDRYVSAMDHWIAFVLLAVIGGKMIWESLREGDADGDEGAKGDALDLRELCILAVATSIDALAVGFGFAALRVSIVPAITLIGCTTFAIAGAGVAVGNFFGARFKRAAEITGGAILILIGLKILLQHLGYLGF